MVDGNGRFCALESVTGQDVMAWVSQGPITDRTKERLGDTDRGVILYQAAAIQQLKRVEAGEDPINVFRDPGGESVHRPAGSLGSRIRMGIREGRDYMRGSATAADPLPQHLKAEIEALFLKASTLERIPG